MFVYQRIIENWESTAKQTISNGPALMMVTDCSLRILKVSIVKSFKDTLRYSNMALEDSPFADNCPTKISIYRGFSQFD
jgi:hypothetical protein